MPESEAWLVMFTVEAVVEGVIVGGVPGIGVAVESVAG